MANPKYDAILGKLREDDSGGEATFPASGGTFTGTVTFPVTGYIMTDSNNVRWRVTIGTDGVMVTQAIVQEAIGTPWLFLFGNI